MRMHEIIRVYEASLSPNERQFITSDGYTLHRHADGMWHDAPEGEEVDLSFDADGEGHPIEDTGERLDGRFV